jgi:hypothetical protein
MLKCTKLVFSTYLSVSFGPAIVLFLGAVVPFLAMVVPFLAMVVLFLAMVVLFLAMVNSSYGVVTTRRDVKQEQMPKGVGGSAVSTICTKKVQNSKEEMRKEERSRKI